MSAKYFRKTYLLEKKYLTLHRFNDIRQKEIRNEVDKATHQ